MAPWSRRSFVRSAGLAAAGALSCGPALFAQRRPPLSSRYSDLQPSFPVRVLPLVSQRSVGTLARGRPSSTGGLRIELRAGARPLRFAIDGGDGAPRALDCRVGRRRDRRQLVGPRQQRQRGDSDVDGRDDGARHPRHLLRGAVHRATTRENYARDLLYLIKNYGDRRHWDCFLLHEHEDGTVGPVFKSFRTILLPTPAPTATASRAPSPTTRQTMCGGGRPMRSASCCAARFRSADAARRFAARSADPGRRLRRHRAVRQLRVARHLAPARGELHGARPGLLVSGQPGVRQHRVSASRARTRATCRRRLRPAAASTTGPRSGSRSGRERQPRAGSPTRSTRPSASRRRRRCRTSKQRVLPRLHQFVQRVARRASVRADEEPRGADRRRARARLSQSATTGAIVWTPWRSSGLIARHCATSHEEPRTIAQDVGFAR